MIISDTNEHYQGVQKSDAESQDTPADENANTIVYIGGFELPDKNAAAQRVVANAQIFKQLGYRVLLVGLSKDRPADGNLYPADSGKAGIEAWEMGYPDNSWEWLRQIISVAALRKLLLETKVRKLDAVICYNHPAISQWRIAKLAQKHQAVAVADCTEWYAKRRWRSLTGAMKNLDVALRMHFINPRMDGLITTSPFISDFYRPHGIPIVEIPTLMAPPETLPVPAIDRSDGRTKLFFAGTGFDKATVAESSDGMKDRLDWVFAILHRAKLLGARFHMDLFGVDQAQYMELVPEQKEILKAMENDITFHGRQPREILLQVLPRAAFSIFFRKSTRTNLAGFPGKLSESISYGTPVITNPMPSSSQFMNDGQTGYLLDASDIDQVAKKLVAVFDQPDAVINSMKSDCYSSDIFHYRSFISPVAEWLSSLNSDVTDVGQSTD